MAQVARAQIVHEKTQITTLSSSKYKLFLEKQINAEYV